MKIVESKNNYRRRTEDVSNKQENISIITPLRVDVSWI